MVDDGMPFRVRCVGEDGRSVTLTHRVVHCFTLVFHSGSGFEASWFDLGCGVVGFRGTASEIFWLLAQVVIVFGPTTKVGFSWIARNSFKNGGTCLKSWTKQG